MKKKGLIVGAGVSWFAWKLLIVVSLTLTIVLCMLAFLSLQRFPPSHSQNPSSVSRRFLHPNWDSISFRGDPKVAFLFLARRNLPLDFLWKSFFEVTWFNFFFLLLKIHQVVTCPTLVEEMNVVSLHKFSSHELIFEIKLGLRYNRQL